MEFRKAEISGLRNLSFLPGRFFVRVRGRKGQKAGGAGLASGSIFFVSR